MILELLFSPGGGPGHWLGVAWIDPVQVEPKAREIGFTAWETRHASIRMHEPAASGVILFTLPERGQIRVLDSNIKPHGFRGADRYVRPVEGQQARIGCGDLV